MRYIILSVFRCCCARAYEQKKTKKCSPCDDLRCSPARNPCAVALTPPSPQDHSRCEHGTLYAPAVQWRQTQRTGMANSHNGEREMNVLSTMTKIYREPTVFEPRAYLRSTKPPSTKPQTEPSSSPIFKRRDPWPYDRSEECNE
jgi:hypothetical protein